MRVSPETAPQIAEGSVQFVHKKFGFALPYTPESLILVDAIVDKIKATGATEQQASGLQLSCDIRNKCHALLMNKVLKGVDAEHTVITRIGDAER